MVRLVLQLHIGWSEGALFAQESWQALLQEPERLLVGWLLL